MTSIARSKGRPSARTGAAAAVALAAMIGPMAGAAQAAAPSAEALQEMSRQLDALRAEQAEAKAAEQARAARVDALARQLAAATGQPVVESAPAGSPLGAAASDGRSFEIYGFAQLDYIHDFNRVHPDWEAALRPSRIGTTTGQYGSDGQDVLSARQSRFGVRASQKIAGKDLAVRFEFDLYGVGVDAGQTTMRLRHFYGSWGPILAGQTNSLFMDGDTFPNTVEYWGPIGMVFLRNPQIRYTHESGPHRFAVAVEKPGNDIDPGNLRVVDPALAGGIQPDEAVPDFTAQYRYGGDWGHVQLAGILRSVGYDTPGTADNRPKGSKTGWGVNLSSNIKVGAKNTIHLSAVYGEGIASYMNDGGTDLGPKGRLVVAPDGRLTGISADVVPTLGLMAYYDHYWSDKWSSSIGWSQHRQYNLSFQSPDAYEDGQYASVNLLYTPDSRLLMGAEYLWGQRKDNDSRTGGDHRIQFTVKYNFSSNDFFR